MEKDEIQIPALNVPGCIKTSGVGDSDRGMSTLAKEGDHTTEGGKMAQQEGHDRDK